MTDCPNEEQLAEFIDGTLARNDREAIVSHLADCDICAAVISDSLTIREEIRSRSRARIRRYIAYAVPSALAAAAVLLLVFRTWQPAQHVSPTPVQEAARRQEEPLPAVPRGKHAGTPEPRSYAASLAARLAQNTMIASPDPADGRPHRPITAFAFSSAVPIDKAAFRTGICLTRLEVARRSKDSKTAEASARQLAELLKPVAKAYRTVPPDILSGGSHEDVSASVETLFANRAEAVYLWLGAWTEAARLAAEVNDTSFLTPDEVRAFRNVLTQRNEPVGTLKDLAQLETLLSSGHLQPDRLTDFARLLADIREMY